VGYNIKKKYKILLKSAKVRNLKVSLNLKHYEDLLELGCMYCGSSLDKENGYCLDRIDNNLGYLDDNVTPCCKICNMAKSSKTVIDFVNWIEKAYNFQKSIFQNTPSYSNSELKKMQNIYFNKKDLKNSQVLELEDNTNRAEQLACAGGLCQII
jgi:hypothetical protein